MKKMTETKPKDPALPTNKCKRCGYEWIPRTSTPKVCPNCQSRDWDKEKDNNGK